ncbi:MAG: GntR family transcriptional regulator [Synergistaceae bacterium]|jgi:DNA-binding GntR family transcriptional regulator|nr:GntR family transcriptional regulator [Synergistaceae bacterium]
MNTVVKDSRLWTKAYEWVKDSVLNGGLEDGEPLSESRLATLVNISRTPIREAFRALARDGYVNLIPGKGAFVSAISVEDVKEIYEVRKLLEPFAARSAVRYIPEALIAEIEDRWREKETKLKDGREVSLREIAALDMEFHAAITKYTQNERIRNILSPYNAQIERFQLLSAKSLSNLFDTIGQHLDLVERIKKRDGGEIACLLLKHIESSEENILRLY